MTSEQCTSLPESEEESSQTTFWDTPQPSQLSGTSTHVESCATESQTGGSMECPDGRGTLENLPHMTGKAEWIAYMQDSLAKILASQGIRQGLAQIRGLDCTEKFYALQTKYDLNTSSWKTCQQSLLEMMEDGSEHLLEILPHAAMMRSGHVYQLPKLEPTISEIDGGYWPSPRANQAMAQTITEKTANHKFRNLETVVAREMFPTPSARDWKGGSGTVVEKDGKIYRQSNTTGEKWGVRLDALVEFQEKKLWATPMAHEARLGYQDRSKGKKGTQKSLTTEVIDDAGGRKAVGGQLNPMWVEWLMGFPIAHTALKD